MTRPENPYEAASYDLKQFRERRMAERRMVPRGTADRRGNSSDAAIPLAPGDKAADTTNESK